MNELYYHILEIGNYGKIASHGYCLSLAEAQSKVDRLKNLFPDLEFQVWPSSKKREPEIVTF